MDRGTFVAMSAALGLTIPLSLLLLAAVVIE